MQWKKKERKGGMKMALVPWRPLAEIDSLRREMDRLWERFFGERPVEWLGGEWVPPLDVSETKNDLIVKAELPGIDPKEVEVTIANGVLTIKGEKKQEKEEKGENYHLMERSYGAFSRSIRLPSDVDEGKIKATYKDGILKVVLPKSEKAKEKTVKIEVQ